MSNIGGSKMAQREIVNQYFDLIEERIEVKNKILQLQRQIKEIEKRIFEMREGEIVKDKVKGGLGGIQTFTIEGFPTKEYEMKMKELQKKKNLLENRQKMASELEIKIAEQIIEVEKFIASIKDSHTRRIVELRVVNGLSWKEVAEEIGGGNTENGVKKIYSRLFE